MNSNMLFLIGTAVIAAVSIPMILGIVPPNRIYGFRTPSTLANRELWYRANTFAGWALLIGAIVSAVLLSGAIGGVLSLPAGEVMAFVLPLLIATGACFVYLHRAQRSGVGAGK
jgi:uncharacterized membrane protein